MSKMRRDNETFISSKVETPDYMNAEVRRVTRVRIAFEAQPHISHNEIMDSIQRIDAIRIFDGQTPAIVTIESITKTISRQTLR